MSIELMSKVWNMDLPVGEKMLLLKLADRANDDGECWPGQKDLSRQCSMSERALRDNLHRLVQKGLVSVRYRRGGMQRKTSIYMLELDPKNTAEIAAPEVESQPAESAAWVESQPADCDIPNRQQLPVGCIYKPKVIQSSEELAEQPAPLVAEDLLLPDDGIVWDARQSIFTNIAEEVFHRWDTTFKGVDVDAELAKAEAWYVANPKRRKRNHLRFLTNWLARAHRDAQARNVKPWEARRPA